ncbi:MULTISPECIES: hypothetical protein [unclassified Romboutsia]|uniref:hypothetical protein n=1 Tax=unclassified Romboutsia TaxID=2626894 RepID=UPI0008226393|nr:MULTISPECIES: hypothetical protein [unclassified Romboutsia]SCI52982.1 Uncharacterised protein [uncultured Clostridium sp.]
MKSTMNLEEHEAMKEKRTRNLKTREESKYNYDDDLSLLISKKKKKQAKNKDSVFRNNYKNYQYDYEEDFYEPL